MQSQNQPPVPSVVSPPVDKSKWLAALTKRLQEIEDYKTLPLDSEAKEYMERAKKQCDVALKIVMSSQPLTLAQSNKIELLIEYTQHADIKAYIQKLKNYVKEYLLKPIPDPLLKIPLISNIEKEQDNLLVDCISLSTMFDPVATIDGYVYENESIVDFFSMNREVKGIRSPKTNVPLPSRDLIPQPVVAMLIKRKMEENPFLLHDQALPVKTMKEAIKTKNLAQVRRLLDKDIIGRFLANIAIIECVNEACSIEIFTLFKDKLKNNAQEQKKIFETLLTIVMEKGNIPIFQELLTLNLDYDPNDISRVLKKIEAQTSNFEMAKWQFSCCQQVPDTENKSSSSSSSSFVSSQIPVDPMRSLYQSSSSESHLRRKRKGGSLERPVAQFQRQNQHSFLQFSSSASASGTSALSAPALSVNQSDFRESKSEMKSSPSFNGQSTESQYAPSVTDTSPRINSNF